MTMTNSKPVLVRDDSTLEVAVISEAEKMKAAALEAASLVVKVSNEAQNKMAVDALTEIEVILKAVEASRAEIKAPILDYGRAIDQKAKEFRAALEAEKMRLGKLAGDFQTLQLAKLRAAEAARLKDLQEIERAKQEALSKATSHEELDAIQERACEEARALPTVAPVRAENQVVREEWEFEVTDKHLLARMHPLCVDITPRRSEIKAQLEQGVKLAGISARKVVKSGVRLSRNQQLITS